MLYRSMSRRGAKGAKNFNGHLSQMDSIDYPFDFIFTTLMPVRIAYPFDPDELETRNPPFVQDLIDLKLHDYHETVSEICKMIADLKQNGKDYHFLKQLKNYAILEVVKKAALLAAKTAPVLIVSRSSTE